METTDTAHLRLAWQPTEEDWAEGFRAVRRTPRARRSRATVWGLLLVWLIAALYLRETAVYAVLAFFACLVLGSTSRVVAKRAMGRYPALRAPAWADVTPAGLTIGMPGVTTVYDWSAVSSVVESERTFVLFSAPMGGRAFNLLAKRGLADPRELPHLRALLQDYVTARRSSVS